MLPEVAGRVRECGEDKNFSDGLAVAIGGGVVELLLDEGVEAKELRIPRRVNGLGVIE